MLWSCNPKDIKPWTEEDKERLRVALDKILKSQEERVYKTYVSTKVKGMNLRFCVKYKAGSEKEANMLAKQEWPFPEYYMIASVLLEHKEV